MVYLLFILAILSVGSVYAARKLRREADGLVQAYAAAIHSAPQAQPKARLVEPFKEIAARGAACALSPPEVRLYPEAPALSVSIKARPLVESGLFVCERSDRFLSLT